ncbi:iron-containing alcohol dehydrogenase (plasmid) [Agrobacterium tumefaciens]|uniref:iron-containing alcohol dehydrogenase n=1 Tax=Agrobacterium tumefaciens TaxID=358 RepID=UPI001F2020C1|nr:iron-containing alcohol dehydrogenase [Agrobacterium tumefaciens]WCK68851.1 iron-containing alcohol dehydrogenase [Agrobacterium tumefaciens]
MSSCVSRITISLSSNGISKSRHNVDIHVHARLADNCGTGCSARLSKLKSKLGARVLVISDGGVVKAGLDQPPLASLAQTGAGTSIFTGVLADPPETVVRRAVARVV